MNKVFTLALLLIGIVMSMAVVSAGTPPAYKTVEVFDADSKLTYKTHILASAQKSCEDTDAGFNMEKIGSVTIWQKGSPSSRTFEDREYNDGTTVWNIEYFCGNQGTVDGRTQEGMVYAFLMPVKVAKQ